MTYVFDTWGYAKRLRDAGVEGSQAEAHAEAARDFIMLELVTKQDLDVRFRVVETEMKNMELRFDSRLSSQIHALEIRLTLRFGAMMAAGIAIIAALIKL